MNSQRRTTIARDQRSEVSLPCEALAKQGGQLVHQSLGDGGRSDQRLTSHLRPKGYGGQAVVCRLSSVVRRHSDQGCRPSSVVRRPASAFTLIELLVAVALLGMAMAMTFTTFYSVSKAWQRGTAMADDLDHGEYVMQQIACGLRSSFFPPSSAGTASSNAANTNAANTNAAPATPSSGGGYGFILEDHGNGVGALDIISWVKTGTALLGLNDPLYKGLHRVRLSIENDGDAGSAVAVRAWRPYANPIDFDPMEIPPHFVSGKVVGLNCRVAKEIKSDHWDWMDTWEDEATNCLPLVVEVTLYLEPLDPDEPPVEIRRTIEIPVAPLSWSGVKKKP